APARRSGGCHRTFTGAGVVRSDYPPTTAAPPGSTPGGQRLPQLAVLRARGAGRDTDQPAISLVLRRAMNPTTTRPASSIIHSAGSGFAAVEKLNPPPAGPAVPDIRTEKSPGVRRALRSSRLSIKTLLSGVPGALKPENNSYFRPVTAVALGVPSGPSATVLLSTFELVAPTVKLKTSANETAPNRSERVWTVGSRVPRLTWARAWPDPTIPVAAITTSRFLSSFMFTPRVASSKLGVSSLAHSTPVAYQGIPADSLRKFIAFLESECPRQRSSRLTAFSGEASGANQAVPDGVAHQPGGLVDAELLHDAIAVRLGGLEGNAEQLADRLGGLALG